MQATRQRILELLRDRRSMTVDELASEVGLTPVTVRHHLEVLKTEGLVESPEVRRRDAPGRPQHTFRLTQSAQSHFPKNYEGFAKLMLSEIRDQLPEDELQRVLAGVAGRMAAEAAVPGPGSPASERVEAVVRYLTDRGYEASWETRADGSNVLRTRNCPYHDLSRSDSAFCSLDLALATRLLGATPVIEERISAGGTSCAYVVAPDPASI